MFRLATFLGLLILAVLTTGCASVKFSPVVAELKAIPDVSVKVSYRDSGIYQVQVRNNSADDISLQWSSSAYVNTSGGTIRLINIPNLDDFPEAVPAEQANSNIARGGRLTSWFVGESWMDFARRGVSPRPRDSESKAAIYLAFNIKGKKIYWKGEVSFMHQ